jgi:hypothetical protein
MAPTVDLQAAERFILLTARLLDRHRYAYLFRGGTADVVVDALRPYQNADGGFGHALECDARGPSSHPGHVNSALQILDEVGRCTGPMLDRALAYLESVTTEKGGVPVAMPSLRGEPRVPWWTVEGDSPPATLIPTAGIVGTLLKSGARRRWIDRAAAFCWEAIEALQASHPNEIHFVVMYLNHAPDRARAEAQAERLGALVREHRMVLLDPDRPEGAVISPGYAPGEYHTPIDYAPEPTSLARRWFSDGEIERALDALAAGQQEDGGWDINWRKWSPAATLEWRGAMTVRALTILRAYGRLA